MSGDSGRDRSRPERSADPYSRLYFRFSREFPAVYADDRLLAAWVRLLMVADASWPMSPPLPQLIARRILARLVEEGLVLVSGHTYSVRGLDAERGRRRNAARDAALVRWQSARNADAAAPAMPAHSGSNATRNADAMPNRTEERRDESLDISGVGAGRLRPSRARARGGGGEETWFDRPGKTVPEKVEATLGAMAGLRARPRRGEE